MSAFLALSLAMLPGAWAADDDGVAAAEDAPEKAAPARGLNWKFDEGFHQRWYVESEVHLPLMMWFAANYNKQARVSAFQLRTVLDCTAKPGARKAKLDCTIEDFALTAAALRGDRGLLDPILAEVDEKLTGAHVTFAMKDNGRISDVRLPKVNHRNRRISRMRENLRLVLIRGLSGLDLQLPHRGEATDGVWAQYQSYLTSMPSITGTTAASDMVHKVASQSDDGTVNIVSGGNVVLSPAIEVGPTHEAGLGETTLNFFKGTVSGEARFDTDRGILVERRWSLLARPTPGSMLAEGFKGLPYGQWGYLVALEPGTTRPVGESKEVSPPGQGPSTLQQWTHLGTALTP